MATNFSGVTINPIESNNNNNVNNSTGSRSGAAVAAGKGSLTTLKYLRPMTVAEAVGAATARPAGVALVHPWSWGPSMGISAEPPQVRGPACPCATCGVQYRGEGCVPAPHTGHTGGMPSCECWVCVVELLGARSVAGAAGDLIASTRKQYLLANPMGWRRAGPVRSRSTSPLPTGGR